MYSKELTQKLAQKFQGTQEVPVPERFTRNPEPVLLVPADKLHEICEFVKTDSDFLFDLPIQMTAVDYIQENQFELVYYLYSTKKKAGLVLKSRIDRANDPAIDSVTDLWPGMDFQEREVYDLMGIKFNNHPNLTRIMMWEGFPGYPLRKDYVHVADKYDSGLEVGTPGLDAKGVPIKQEEKPN